MKTAESVLQDARSKNEPVFVLRAQDRCAMKAMLAYLRTCKEMNCSEEHIQGVIDIDTEFSEWRVNNPEKLKLPD